MAAWRYEIFLLVLKKYFTRSLRSVVKYFSTLEEKFRISARLFNISLYSYFEKGCRNKCARDNPERWLRYGIWKYGIWAIRCSWHCICRTYFCCFPLALANICPWPLVPFFQISLKEQWTQNHPQYLSGLSRALFPTTFLEIAVYSKTSQQQLQQFWVNLLLQVPKTIATLANYTLF